jgi:hypothetical protein
MIEERNRKKGLTFRVKRFEGRLTATFTNRPAAELQDALWARWGESIPVLMDKQPQVPLTLRTRLLDKRTAELSDQLLADLLARHPAASHVISSESLTVGEYIVETFLDVWEEGRAPGARSGRRGDDTVKEMKRSLNNIVFELEYEVDENGNALRADGRRVVVGWGDDAWAWTPMDQVTAQSFLALDQKVKKLGYGLEVWRKVRNFLDQMFRYARLDASSGFPPDRANPIRDVPAPRQQRRVKRQAYLPDVVEEIRADFLFLAALSAAGVRRVRGGEEIETPGGVPIPPNPEFAIQAADLVEMLAYGGVRPGEALGAMGKGHNAKKPDYFRVDQRNVNANIVPGTKSLAYDWKDVRLLGPLPESIARKAAAAGKNGLLFPQLGTSRPWSKSAYKNWCRRYFGPIAQSRGLGPESDDPYTLRHVYSSIRIAAGHPKPYIDESLGSSLSDSVYKTVLRDLEQQGLAGTYDIDAAVAEARALAVADLHERLEAAGLDPARVPS